MAKQAPEQDNAVKQNDSPLYIWYAREIWSINYF